MKSGRGVVPKLTVALMFAATAVVLASTGRSIDLSERARGSQAIVVATTVDGQSRWERNAAGDRLIVTRLQLRVEESLKGTPYASRFVDVEGGTIDGVTLHVSSTPELKPGDRAVFMLDDGPGGVNRPHLKGLGILKLDAGNRAIDAGITLDDIRRAVRAAR